MVLERGFLLQNRNKGLKCEEFCFVRTIRQLSGKRPAGVSTPRCKVDKIGWRIADGSKTYLQITSGYIKLKKIAVCCSGTKAWDGHISKCLKINMFERKIIIRIYKKSVYDKKILTTTKYYHSKLKCLSTKYDGFWLLMCLPQDIEITH